jgi:hypothetical protein
MASIVPYIPINVRVANITKGVETSVTTSLPNFYVVGQLVRFHIPNPYGMVELNNQLAYVTSVSSATNFTVDVNTLKFTDFISSPTYPGNMRAQVSAVGDKNNSSRTTTSNGSTVSGAFINNTNPNR